MATHSFWHLHLCSILINYKSQSKFTKTSHQNHALFNCLDCGWLHWWAYQLSVFHPWLCYPPFLSFFWFKSFFEEDTLLDLLLFMGVDRFLSSLSWLDSNSWLFFERCLHPSEKSPTHFLYEIIQRLAHRQNRLTQKLW